MLSWTIGVKTRTARSAANAATPLWKRYGRRTDRALRQERVLMPSWERCWSVRGVPPCRSTSRGLTGELDSASLSIGGLVSTRDRLLTFRPVGWEGSVAPAMQEQRPGR